MTIDIDQLCIDHDAKGNPLFAEYRFAVIAHDDLGGWLLAIDDGRYVICETDDAVNVYGRDRDELMARHDRNEWADKPHGEGAPVSRLAQLEADNAALMKVVRAVCRIRDASEENSIRRICRETLSALPAHLKEEASK